MGCRYVIRQFVVDLERYDVFFVEVLEICAVQTRSKRLASIYEGCPKMPYNCIVSLKFITNITSIHMQPVGTLFPDILLKLHKIS